MKQLLVLAVILFVAVMAQASDLHCEGDGSFGQMNFHVAVDVKDDGTEEGLSARVLTTFQTGTSEYPSESEKDEKTVDKAAFEGEEKLAELFKSLEHEHNTNQELADVMEQVKTKNPDAKAPPVSSTWRLLEGKEVESAVIYYVRPSDPMGAVRSFTLKDKSVLNVFVADFMNPVLCAK